MSKVYFNPSDDLQMDAAYAAGRNNFKYYWREMAADFQRIVPALAFSQVKMRFFDTTNDIPDAERLVEFMWVQVDGLDGDTVYGELMNQPNHLQTFNQGDRIALPLHHIVDWMYGFDNHVLGGYTINLMRSRMPASERKQHDKAWGLKFGDPAIINVVDPNTLIDPNAKKGFMGFGAKPLLDPETVENGMALTIAGALRDGKFTDLNPNEPGQYGNTILHDMALAGAKSACDALLDMGADKKIKNSAGYTASDLAGIIGWPELATKLKP